MSNNKEDEELIRLSEVLKTLKEDAIEVSDLIIKGIEYHKLIAYIAVLIGIFSTWSAWANDIFWSPIAILSFLLAFLLFYKHRKLKKKYKELVDIRTSLLEE